MIGAFAFGWLRRHLRWQLAWVLVAVFAWKTGLDELLVLAIFALAVPVMACSVWHSLSPSSYERLLSGPYRRFRWRRNTRRRWERITEACGLSSRVPRVVRRDGKRQVEHKLVHPRLRKVRTHGHTLELTIRTRAGQTVEDLDNAVPRIAATLGAVAHRTRPVSGAAAGCTTIAELVMTDALTHATNAVSVPAQPVYEWLTLGRTQSGGAWGMRILGRQTLVAGCSGSGKGSVLWGVCCGLAPAVRAGLVQLWGVDLKRGVELAMGSKLFSAHAYKPAEALDVLKALHRVIDERGARMVDGHIREHTPTPDEPLHVLVIDELAALTAYADLDIRREAEKLLKEILTQGRAMGVSVIACVQDPRKDVVEMRGLFLQTVALRLRSSDETVMVLGDGMTQIAPAHRIPPTSPGTAWVVEDTGAADRVRADYWSDEMIRSVADRYATNVRVDLTPAANDEPEEAEVTPLLRKRSPRASTREAAEV